MTERLRFAEAVCAGHPDRLADTIAERIVTLAVARDPEALVGVEVALHRNVVFVDGRVAAGRRETAAVDEAEIVAIARQVFADAGYGATPSGVFPPRPRGARGADRPLPRPAAGGRAGDPRRERRPVDLRRPRRLGPARRPPPPRAGARHRLRESLERLRVERPDLGLGPDGKTLVAVRGRALVGVSLSVHHAPGVDWVALTREARAACEAVAAEYVPWELEPLGADVDWLVNGAGAFEVGGPGGDNGLSGKKLVAQAYGSAVPIGGGATYGKDPHKVDPRGQALARELALEAVVQGERARSDRLAGLSAGRRHATLDRGDRPSRTTGIRKTRRSSTGKASTPATARG